MTSAIAEIFVKNQPDPDALNRIQDRVAPKVQYIIAMTPRSGSSRLTEVIKNTKVLGRPGESLAAKSIPRILGKIPARNADEYLVNVMKQMQTPNKVSGLKTSWFQFKKFCDALSDHSVLQNYKYIYLIRRDTSGQAVSLYKAVESTVFHTNVSHSSEALNKVAELDYDYHRINKWHQHILKQESGWQKFFLAHKIFPLIITYEDIESDVDSVIERIAAYLNVELNPEITTPTSIFNKVGNRVNVEWACQFTLDHDSELRQIANTK